MATDRPLRGTDLKRFNRRVRRTMRPDRRLTFVLEHVLYPVNVGGMFRIADACDAEVVLVGPTPRPEDSPKIGKVGRGKHTRVPWRHTDDITDALSELRGDGFWVAAVEITADAVPYHTVDYPDRVALVVGNEDHGVTRPALAACDRHLFVPMFGRGASLNVHVAAAVVGYRTLLDAPSRPSSPST